jgi:hypothetical protein
VENISTQSGGMALEIVFEKVCGLYSSERGGAGRPMYASVTLHEGSLLSGLS